MAHGYTIHHCEWLAKYAYADAVTRPDTFDVVLYDDGVDDLEADADVGDITTEPTDGNYERATLTFPGDVAIYTSELAADVKTVDAAFDFAGTTGEVDTAGVIWETELADDGIPTEHLMARCELDDRYELDTHTGEYTVEARWQIHALF